MCNVQFEKGVVVCNRLFTFWCFGGHNKCFRHASALLVWHMSYYASSCKRLSSLSAVSVCLAVRNARAFINSILNFVSCSCPYANMYKRPSFSWKGFADTCPATLQPCVALAAALCLSPAGLLCACMHELSAFQVCIISALATYIAKHHLHSQIYHAYQRATVGGHLIHTAVSPYSTPWPV